MLGGAAERIAAAVGAPFTGLLMTALDQTGQRIIAARQRITVGEQPAGGGPIIDSVGCGVPGWSRFPRRTSGCQYVVASGQVECLSNPRAGEGFSTYSCPPAAMPRLLACDDALAANQQPGGMHFRMREAVGALLDFVRRIEHSAEPVERLLRLLRGELNPHPIPIPVCSLGRLIPYAYPASFFCS